MSDNFKGMDFGALQRMSEQAEKMLNIEMQKFEKSFDEVRKTLPEEQLGTLDKAKAKFNQAINLAKEGRTEEATAIINTFKNGS